MQKSKYAKVKNNSCNAKSKYGELSILPHGQGLDF